MNDIGVEMTEETAQRFMTWLQSVAKPDIDLELLDYEMDGVLGQEGALYTLHTEVTRSGRPETYALKRDDVIIKQYEK